MENSLQRLQEDLLTVLVWWTLDLLTTVESKNRKLRRYDARIVGRMDGAQLARSVARIPPTLARRHWRAARSPGPRCPVAGASTLPAPASRRFPAVEPCSETTCRGRVRARPVRWICDPSGGWPGVVGTVAHAAATRRGRWWARWRNGHHGASVGRAVWGRVCSARGSQAGTALVSTCRDWRDALYKIPRFIYHHPRSISTTGHRPHKQPEYPQ